MKLFPQVTKSGELIHQIDTDDHDVIDEIEMFSLQIANENVEFSAAGFFPINYTLVFSVSGTRIWISWKSSNIDCAVNLGLTKNPFRSVQNLFREIEKESH
jgi:hypothetical protein